MSSNLEKVLEFHKVFGMLVNENPTMIDTSSMNLRLKLIEEEFNELYVEMVKYDAKIENIAKEMADLLYVVYGTAVSMGIDMNKIFEEVHKSNMSKLDENGKVVRRADGKVLKSNLYKSADIEEIIKNASISKFI